MSELVLPKTYFIGETSLRQEALNQYLSDTDQLEFLEEINQAREEGLSDGEILCSFFAKSCYSALTTKKNKNISKVRAINDNIVGTVKSRHGSVFEHCLLNFMIADCSRVFTHELVRHRVGTAFCLSGDTEVWSGSKVDGRWDGVRKKWTMKQLYDWSLDSKRKGRIKLIKVRCLHEGKFVQAHIKTVIKSEEKTVYEVLLRNGKKIKCSEDHRFLTKQHGWLPVKDMSFTDELATNGVKKGLASTNEKENARRLKISKSQLGSGNSMWTGDEVGTQGARKRSRKFRKNECEECGKTKDLHVHHKDRDLLNNDPSNLKTLCNSCHGKLHNFEDGNPNELLPVFSEIESITELEKEMTYDLEIDHPAHNFVANGIVTHNSQTSGRYVRTDNLKLVYDSILDPCKRTVCEVLDYIENKYKQMEKEMDIDSEAKFSVKKKVTSAMRRILPNGQSNEIGFSVNLRTLRQTIIMRTSIHAEWEIRFIFNQIFDLVEKVYPAFFMDAKKEDKDGLWEITFENGKI